MTGTPDIVVLISGPRVDVDTYTGEGIGKVLGSDTDTIGESGDVVAFGRFLES